MESIDRVFPLSEEKRRSKGGDRVEGKEGKTVDTEKMKKETKRGGHNFF